jgi:pimeloyl-ACP methyl ester carboxylesterase
MLSVHWIDRLLVLPMLRPQLFVGGLGDLAQVEPLVAGSPLDAPPRPISIRWGARRIEGELAVRDGTFSSPVSELPGRVRLARVREILPSRARCGASEQPMYVVLAATGEEGFSRRMQLYRPLVRASGIGALLLESPFYGPRRPPGQKGSVIRTLSESVLMGYGMIEEARSLLAWLAGEGHTRLGISGFSLGGTMGAIAAARWPGPIAAAIFAAGLSAVPLYAHGVYARAINLKQLGRSVGGAAVAKEWILRCIAALDIDRHPLPQLPAATVLVGAKHDGYIPTAEVQRLHEHWRGSELRWLPTGHAGALLQHAEALRQAAVDAMRRL